MFNRDLFRAKCIEHGIRTQDAAQIMGINPATLSRKMGGQSDFTRNDKNNKNVKIIRATSTKICEMYKIIKNTY